MKNNLVIKPKFAVGQQVEVDFDDEFFIEGNAVIREINIKVSCVGIHTEYTVSEVKNSTVIKEFKMDECYLIPIK